VEHRVRDTAKLSLDATTQRICLKIADDFRAKSADNGCDLEPGALPGTSGSDHHREELS
jgi:hypothetical protein